MILTASPQLIGTNKDFPKTYLETFDSWQIKKILVNDQKNELYQLDAE